MGSDLLTITPTVIQSPSSTAADFFFWCNLDNLMTVLVAILCLTVVRGMRGFNTLIFVNGANTSFPFLSSTLLLLELEELDCGIVFDAKLLLFLA